MTLDDIQVQANALASSIIERWNVIKNAKTGWFVSTVDLVAASKFFIAALDEAIRFAQENMTVGAEKKAFVLLTISKLYDIMITPYLPLWLYPWQSAIKNLVINSLISNLIEYIVSKYREGKWVFTPVN